MDQVKIGKFIAQCRKNQKLTQAQLAEKLNITDRAISKWETGNGIPDSSIMLELCNILGISVNELLSGEKINIKDYDKKAEKNLIELKRKDENNIMKNTILSIIFSFILFIGIVVCIICDLAISGKFVWSPIAISSIILAWLILIPIIKLGKRGICGSLISFSLFIIPYLYVLSILIKQNSVFIIGAIMSVIVIVYVWCVFGIFSLFKTRKMKAIGVTLLLSIPFCLIINIILSKIVLEPIIDIWDILSTLILFIFAGICFVYDYNKYKDNYKL